MINDMYEKYYMSDSLLEREYDKSSNIWQLIFYIYHGMLGIKQSGNTVYDKAWSNYREVEDLIYSYLVNMYNRTSNIENFFRKEHIKNIAKYTFDKDDTFLCSSNIKRENNNFCKIYLAVNRSEYVKVIREICYMLELLKRYNSSYMVNFMFRMNPTNEGVSIGLGSYDEYSLFMDMLNTNKKIVSNLTKPNLFIPSIDGIGIMPNNNGTYLKLVSKILASYVYSCVMEGEVVSLEGFSNYLMNLDFGRNSGFDIICRGNQVMLDNFRKIMISKIDGVSDEDIIKETIGLVKIKRLKK